MGRPWIRTASPLRVVCAPEYDSSGTSALRTYPAHDGRTRPYLSAETRGPEGPAPEQAYEGAPDILDALAAVTATAVGAECFAHLDREYYLLKAASPRGTPGGHAPTTGGTHARRAETTLTPHGPRPDNEETPSDQLFRADRRGFLVRVAAPGFEPGKAEPADLQSAPFGRSGTPPGIAGRASGARPGGPSNGENNT